MTNQRPIKLLPRFGPILAILAIVESSMSGNLEIGPALTFVTAVFSLISINKAIASISGMIACISMLFMLSLTKNKSSLHLKLQEIQACAQYSSNNTIPYIDPSNGTYPLLEEFGVEFSGSHQHFSEAGNCEINLYDKTHFCYCSDHHGGCLDFRKIVDNCNVLLSTYYQDRVGGAYFVGIMVIIALGIYIMLCLHFLFSKAPILETPGVEMIPQFHHQDQHRAVPTTASIVEPTIVTQESLENGDSISYDNYHKNMSSFIGYFGLRTKESSSSTEITIKAVQVDV